jgi:hypothetical protein
MSKQDLTDFRAHLIASGKSKGTAEGYLQRVRHFLKHVDEPRIDRITEELARRYFATVKNKSTKHCSASAISQFLKFTAARLPVPVTRGAKASRASVPVPAKLQQRWSVDKLVAQKSKDDDLIAKLARKVIDAYLLSGRAIKGDFNLDDFVRFHDEARDVIESNLTLFMGLSADGRNIHSAIDERVNR